MYAIRSYYEFRRACGVVEALGGSFELDIKHGYPSTVNDPEATETAFDALGDLLGVITSYSIHYTKLYDSYLLVFEKNINLLLNILENSKLEQNNRS